VPWLQAHAGGYDVACFVTYLYPPAIFGMAAARPHVPTMFMPAAHDEPPLYFPLFDSVFRQADAFAFYTPEERALVVRRFGLEPPGRVTGIGIDLVGPGDGARFRGQFALGSRPYLLYLGRVDPSQGSLEAAEFFMAYKRRHDDDLALVVMGEQVAAAPDHPDIVYTGFVDEATKRDGLAGALALVQPSYFESFSIVLCEAWVQGVPALVQRECEVLDGQARRSGGAIPYGGFAQFEAAVELLMEDEGLRRALGASGRRYVEEHYRWPVVLDGFEAVAAEAQAQRARRSAVGSPGQ
jgi:glycosyltransferase involved in cell wall biosynthesis